MALDLVGRFCNSGIDIEGTGKSMLELSQRVLKIRGQEMFELSIPSTPPFPYDGYLRFLRFDIGEGLVHIRREGDCMLVRGSVEKIEMFASNIASLALQETDSISLHAHIEYYSGHFFLLEGSEPIILTRKDAIKLR